MSDLLLEIATYLNEENKVEGDGVDTFRDFMPESPDQAISLYEEPGQGTFYGAGGAARKVKVLVRGSHDDPDWARVKVWEIFNTLDIPDRIIDTRETHHAAKLWGVFKALYTPFKLKTDENGRDIYIFTLGVTTHRD